MVFLFEESNILDLRMVIYDCKAKGVLYVAYKNENDSMTMMGPMISPKKLQNKFSEFAEKFLGEPASTHLTHTISQSKFWKNVNLR